MWLQVKDLARQEGVCRQTIQKRIRDGHYSKVKVTEGGHYRIWVDKEPKIILYGRVSTSKQLSSIDTQREMLFEKYKGENFIYDIGSGFNFERRGFKTILEQALSGVPLIVVVTSRDRLARAGLPLIEKIIKLSGGRIVSLDDSDEIEEFDTRAFIGFITSFISSYYGKRTSKRRGRPRNTKNTDTSKE